MPWYYTTVALLLALARAAAGPHTLDGAARCPLDSDSEAHVTINPLKDLAPLQKVHFSWPLPPRYLASSSPDFLDGLVHDYVRITGSCNLNLGNTQHCRQPTADDLNRTMLDVCAEICEAVAAKRAAAKLPPPTVSVGYSPWYACFPGNDPTVAGPAEAAELAMYRTMLADVRAWLPTAGNGTTKLGAVLLDSEKFKFTSSSTVAYRGALTRKNDLIWNLTREVFPERSVRIEQYDRGAMTKWDTDPTWQMAPYYTLQEQGESLTLSLYTVPEIWNMRASMNRTVALARSRFPGDNVPVNPWIALGVGNRRLPKMDGESFDLCWDYDRVYSWQMGREINTPWFGQGVQAARYAPWGAAQLVLFYPSVFDVRGRASGPENRSTNLMQHFVNYVRGANGLDGLTPS